MSRYFTLLKHVLNLLYRTQRIQIILMLNHVQTCFKNTFYFMSSPNFNLLLSSLLFLGLKNITLFFVTINGKEVLLALKFIIVFNMCCYIEIFLVWLVFHLQTIVLILKINYILILPLRILLYFLLFQF
jgi:hypothetical protein